MVASMNECPSAAPSSRASVGALGAGCARVHQCEVFLRRMSPQYYFDHAASAPRRDAVSEAMARWQHGDRRQPLGQPPRRARGATGRRRRTRRGGGTRGRQTRWRGLYRRGQRVVFSGAGRGDSSPPPESRSHRAYCLQDRAPRGSRYGRRRWPPTTRSVNAHFLDVDDEGVVDLDALRDAPQRRHGDRKRDGGQQ